MSLLAFVFGVVLFVVGLVLALEHRPTTKDAYSLVWFIIGLLMFIFGLVIAVVESGAAGALGGLS
jgi:uncharacterized membrane protein YczE